MITSNYRRFIEELYLANECSSLYLLIAEKDKSLSDYPKISNLGLGFNTKQIIINPKLAKNKQPGFSIGKAIQKHLPCGLADLLIVNLCPLQLKPERVENLMFYLDRQKTEANTSLLLFSDAPISKYQAENLESFWVICHLQDLIKSVN